MFRHPGLTVAPSNARRQGPVKADALSVDWQADDANKRYFLYLRASTVKPA